MENAHLVLGIGLGASLVWSLLLVMGFSASFGCFIWVAIGMLFVLLVALDYCLFVKAGIATGRSAESLLA